MAFVAEHVSPHAIIYTDGSTSYTDAGDRYAHEAVRHSVGEYVRGQAHTNGIESFWSMLKRAHMDTFHRMSAKHLSRRGSPMSVAMSSALPQPVPDHEANHPECPLEMGIGVATREDYPKRRA